MGSYHRISRDRAQPGERFIKYLVSRAQRLRSAVTTCYHFVLDPEGEEAFLWSTLLSSVVMYNLWAIILRISFSEMRNQEFPIVMFLVVDFLADASYILDVFLQFRMGYLEDGILVRDISKSVSYYRKHRHTEYLVDIVAAAPLSNIFLLFEGFVSSVTPAARHYADMVFLLLRLPKLVKFHSLSKLITTWDMKTNAPNALRAGKLLLFLATTIHWIGCLYHMISEVEGLGSNTWVLSKAPPDCSSPFFRKYLRSIYWSTVTLTTIGNDSSPCTNVEYIFTGCVFLIGVFLFATVVGNVGDVISNMNAARMAFQQKMDGIKMYMRYHKVPANIQTKVKKWAEYSWNRNKAMDDISALDILPFRLRTEIAKYVHLETLQKVKIFEGCEQGLLCELVVRLRSQIYSPSDYICRKGEIGKEMYIINHGRVQVLIPKPNQPGSDMVVATLQEGNYFGEISLLKLEEGCNRRNADVRSVGYSELLVLSKQDLSQALVEYPVARRVLEEQARDRIHKIRSETLHVQTPVVPCSKVDEVDNTGIKPNQEATGHELSSLISELRAFDSQATKKELEMLRKQCNILQCKLEQKSRHMEWLKPCPSCRTSKGDPSYWPPNDQYPSNNTSSCCLHMNIGQNPRRTPSLTLKGNGHRSRVSSKTKRKRTKGFTYRRTYPNMTKSIFSQDTDDEDGIIPNCEFLTNEYNKVPSVINGCLCIDSECESMIRMFGENKVRGKFLSVIVPQISINGELWQESKIIRLPTPEWLQDGYS